VAPLFALRGCFSRQIFRDVNFRHRVKSLIRAIHTLAVDGLWRNSEVGKAFETACISVHIGRAIVMALMAMRGQSLVQNDQTN
jgi:hypothetical protein